MSKIMDKSTIPSVNKSFKERKSNITKKSSISKNNDINFDFS